MCVHTYATLAIIDVGLENSQQNPTVYNQSAFDVPPSPEVDAAWEDFYSRSKQFLKEAILVVYIVMITLRGRC